MRKGPRHHPQESNVSDALAGHHTHEPEEVGKGQFRTSAEDSAEIEEYVEEEWGGSRPTPAAWIPEDAIWPANLRIPQGLSQNKRRRKKLRDCSSF